MNTRKSHQVFANSKFIEWHRGGGKGDLASLEEVMALEFARSAFENSTTPCKRFGFPVGNRAFMFFDPYHIARRYVYNMVKHPYFDLFVLAVIIVSTVLLALDNPTTRESKFWQDLFTICDDVFLVIFTIEFLLKLFAFGVLFTDNVEFMLAEQDTLKDLVLGDMGEPSYLCSAWNYLDIVVLVVGYINRLGDPEGPLKILRLLRAFRPLRMVNRVAGMKLVLGALLSACPALANVCILLLAVFIIFAILGLSLFMGKFFACTDGESNRADCAGHFISDDGYAVPAVWNNPGLDGFGENSFDNLFTSLLILFEVATGDSWETVLFLMTDVPAEVGDAAVVD